MILDLGDSLQPVVGLGGEAKVGEDFQEGSSWGGGEVAKAILTLRIVEPVRGRFAGAELRQREGSRWARQRPSGRRVDRGQLHSLAGQ